MSTKFISDQPPKNMATPDKYTDFIVVGYKSPNDLSWAVLSKFKQFGYHTAAPSHLWGFINFRTIAYPNYDGNFSFATTKPADSIRKALKSGREVIGFDSYNEFIREVMNTAHSKFVEPDAAMLEKDSDD